MNFFSSQLDRAYQIAGFESKECDKVTAKPNSRKKVSKKDKSYFEEEFISFILSFTSIIRSGVDIFEAFLRSKTLYQMDKSLIYSEITQLVSNIEDGMSFEEAILLFGEKYNNSDCKLFQSAVKLSLSHGGSLGETLEKLAQVLRQRQAFKRKTRSALALQKMSALGMILAVIAVLLVQSLSQADALTKTLASPIGLKFIICGLALSAVGLLLLWKMLNQEVI
jgi:Flp pilus assembly protein TadB